MLGLGWTFVSRACSADKSHPDPTYNIQHICLMKCFSQMLLLPYTSGLWKFKSENQKNLLKNHWQSFFCFLVSFETFHKNILSGTQSHFFHKSVVYLFQYFILKRKFYAIDFFLTFGVFCYVQTPKIFLAYFLYYEKYEIGRLIHSLCNFLLQPKIYYARQEYVIEF